ncbi:hypothetical protein OG21DRAFT_1290462 [Imleria badia]|nr:hypothetical protein OG21DRAFT_1290462 [Imleria badia]
MGEATLWTRDGRCRTASFFRVTSRTCWHLAMQPAIEVSPIHRILLVLLLASRFPMGSIEPWRGARGVFPTHTRSTPTAQDSSWNRQRFALPPVLSFFLSPINLCRSQLTYTSDVQRRCPLSAKRVEISETVSKFDCAMKPMLQSGYIPAGVRLLCSSHYILPVAGNVNISKNVQELDAWIMSCETLILSLLWVRPTPLPTILKLRCLTIPVLISLLLPFLGCEVPKRVFGSIVVLLDVARPDIFSTTTLNTRLPSIIPGVTEASIYTRV